MNPRRYSDDQLSRIAFPLGGLGAGMVCLDGTGSFSHLSLRHKPEVFNEPTMFAAIHVRKHGARVIEGPVPAWKAFGAPGTGNGASGRTYGLPRFSAAAFSARFPFATVVLRDAALPVRAEITGWSPFVPGNADDSSLPLAVVEYEISNPTSTALDVVFSFHAANFMRVSAKSNASVQPMANGFVLRQPPLPDAPTAEAEFGVFVDDTSAASGPGRGQASRHGGPTSPALSPNVDTAWFRGGWFDALTMVWNTIAAGEAPAKPPHPDAPGNGGSIYVPLKLKAKSSRTVRMVLVWYVPDSDLKAGNDVEPVEASGPAACGPGCDCAPGEPSTYRPWYAQRFRNLPAVADYARSNLSRLRADSSTFSDALYDTTLPPEVLDAVAANLTILKSPTCLRQHDGRFWAWEGCSDSNGCCHGTCTHVWNYAQALPHLFPALERTLRETEFVSAQDGKGHQNFRASLPIRATPHDFHAAADGQLGGIIKLYREWRISGDTAWMQSLLPRAKASLDYCIGTWDPGHTGTLVEPHHNTYDIEFWGADGMCTSFYLAALAAYVEMAGTASTPGRLPTSADPAQGAAPAEPDLYSDLLARGRSAMESTLWNGQYFIQNVQWEGLRAGDPIDNPAIVNSTGYSPEAVAILQKEGPKYQYGTGCLSDGVLGDWMARTAGLGAVLSVAKTAGHLDAVFRHNFRRDLSTHANPQRPAYAMNHEAGLLLCSWPNGGKPSLPFVYSDEVWTGIEYQVAGHLIMMGRVDEGRKIVRAVRNRYDGSVRNPFNEYECGHWYARAMSSYGLLQAWSGARYDAVTQALHVAPAVKGDFRCFLSTATGFGIVGVKNGKPFLDVRFGTIRVKTLAYVAAGAAKNARQKPSTPGNGKRARKRKV